MAANSFHSILSVSSFLFTHHAAPVLFCLQFFIHECTFCIYLILLFVWKPQLHLYRFSPQLFCYRMFPLFRLYDVISYGLTRLPAQVFRCSQSMFIFLRNSPCKNTCISITSSIFLKQAVIYLVSQLICFSNTLKPLKL